jgi:hypothetical protein
MNECHMMQIIRNRPIIKRSQLRQRQVFRVGESRLDLIGSFLIADHHSPHQFDLFVEFAQKEPPVKGVKEALSIDVRP